MTGEGLWYELLELLPKYKLPPSAHRKELLGEKPKKTEVEEDPERFLWFVHRCSELTVNHCVN